MFGIFEAAVLASSLSVDSLAAGFAYGSKKIRIPMLSLQIINVICCAVIGAAMFFGNLVRPLLSEELAVGIGFTVLFCMGLAKLADGLVKKFIRKISPEKEIRFSAFNAKFILQVYATPEAADSDTSAHLSAGEAIALALALSLDGMAAGFAAVLAGVNPWALLAWSFAANTIMLVFGQKLGRRLARKFDIAWVGGLVLIALAFSRLLI
ncbi:MAG: manganese efflux pump [Defluviitaleaceae bacterium]|nr:manganese efflux pump [Defluviitaleaceae bacterium]